MDLFDTNSAIELVQARKTIIATVCVAVISLILLRRWFVGGWCYSQTLLHGKTVIITGANTGIGKDTARDLLRRGARVILACRSLERATRAAAELGPDNKGEIVVRHLDLASLKSIRAFVDDILATESRIDILINNAGLVYTQAKTEDGFELQFGTNHLGHFLLTNLLLDKIKSSAPARIINVSSLAHTQGKIHWDDINLEKPGAFKPFTAYSQSKLANVLFTRELAKRLKGSGVNIYAVHPGAVKTEFGRKLGDILPAFIVFLLHVLGPLFTKSSEQGAQTSIYCAVADEVEQQTGLYYSDCAVKQPANQALDDDAAKRLWDLSAKMVGIQQ